MEELRPPNGQAHTPPTPCETCSEAARIFATFTSRAYVAVVCSAVFGATLSEMYLCFGLECIIVELSQRKGG